MISPTDRDPYTDYRIYCADLGLENRRIASHIVQRGILVTGEECYAPEAGRAGRATLPHTCADCQGRAIF